MVLRLARYVFLPAVFALTACSPQKVETSWEETTLQRFGDAQWYQPIAFTEISAENQFEESWGLAAVTGKIGNAVPVKRWFWNYGGDDPESPEYDAAVIAARSSALPFLPDFEFQVSAHRSKTMRSKSWQTTQETGSWLLQQGMADFEVPSERRHNGLLRIMATAPKNGIWLGLVAKDDKLPPEIAAQIFDKMLQSVQPMHEAEKSE